MKEINPRRGLFCRRQCLVPTWRGWLLLLGVAVIGFYVALRTAHPFLAVSSPVPGGVLVVEGWLPDFALEEAIAEFKRHPYSALYVTGGPIERGAPLIEYKNYANLSAAIIERLGLQTNVLFAVPAPKIRQDRTFTSAVALKQWLAAHGPAPAKINIFTLGPHSRRSRLLFEKAFGKGFEIGVVSVEDQNYDPQRWWTSSIGFRTVVDEMVAYAYARFWFRAPKT